MKHKHASIKNKINDREHTAAEIVAVEDVIGSVLWTRSFLEVACQDDDQGTILVKLTRRKSVIFPFKLNRNNSLIFFNNEIKNKHKFQFL
jgi:hypothetical protein